MCFLEGLDLEVWPAPRSDFAAQPLQVRIPSIFSMFLMRESMRHDGGWPVVLV